MVWEAVPQYIGAANLKEFLPYRVDLICGISKILLYLKKYLEFFIWTRSWRPTGAILLIILYVSKAMVLILLICKEGTLTLCSNSSQGLLQSSFTKRSALSCTFFKCLSVQKYQAKRQKLKLLSMNVWKMVNLFSNMNSNVWEYLVVGMPSCRLY